MTAPMQQARNYKPLSYSIAYCSGIPFITSILGEDEDHPASELLNSGPNSKGWESPRFGSFPQIIVLQLNNLSMLKQIQFLSHQVKIATKIELFVYAPTPGTPFPPASELGNLKFNRIGYLSLDSNERSKFTARELKSVYLDVPAYYLKVAFHKCHSNKQNVFNQVGVIAINCLGEIVEATEKLEVPRLVNQPSDDGNTYDSVTSEKLKLLNEAKEKAVAQEDFDEAKKIKEIMDKLKGIGKQLAVLEQKKKAAIENEDYETAKTIKIEIDRLRDSVFREKEEQAQTRVVRPSRGKEMIEVQQENLLEEEKNPEPTPEKKMTKLPGIRGEEIKGEELDEEAKRKLRESMPLPTQVNKGKKPQPQEYEEESPHEEGETQKGKEPTEKAEPLSGNTKTIAEPYFTLVEMELLEMLFSKNWGWREAGLDKISEELESKKYVLITMDDEEKIMVTMLGLVNHLISDKVAQVTQKAMGVIETILKFYPNEVNTLKTAFNTNVDNCLSALMEKIGDNNPKLRIRAEETCLSFASQKHIGLSVVASIIIKTPTAAGKKEKNPAKSLQSKLNLLSKMIQSFGLESKSGITQPVIDYALKGVKNNTSEVRNAAYALLVEIHKHIGTKIQSYLEDLRPAQKEMLEKEFSKAEGAPQEIEEPEAAPKVAAKPKKVLEKKKKESQPSEPVEEELPSEPQKEGEKICEYCGKFGENFTQDNLDLHMFNECPMLYMCTGCENVIEIININNHLLKECTAKEEFKECPVCHEAFPKDQLDEHVDEGACKAFDPKKVVRCPLCHMDIKPATIEMWRDHILVKQCPNNERRPL